MIVLRISSVAVDYFIYSVYCLLCSSKPGSTNVVSKKALVRNITSVASSKSLVGKSRTIKRYILSIYVVNN